MEEVLYDDKISKAIFDRHPDWRDKFLAIRSFPELSALYPRLFITECIVWFYWLQTPISLLRQVMPSDLFAIIS